MWVEFIFKDSSTPKKLTGVTRLYTKAGFRCVELSEYDEDGNPIVIAYPIENIFQEARPHLHHIGTEKRGRKKKERRGMNDNECSVCGHNWIYG